ncbi:hypothetical protein AVEN_222386-1 [Araneus ventricosus]|uniref:Uncharacterized protein n=1 Tax=Araneus ventricosus TaxID=182803 RepID=A0A4Y2LSV9_ARAVE|nr:hypothetical protein AVEN_222386-1 [Araneus ventricosus]
MLFQARPEKELIPLQGNKPIALKSHTSDPQEVRKCGQQAVRSEDERGNSVNDLKNEGCGYSFSSLSQEKLRTYRRKSFRTAISIKSMIDSCICGFFL